MVNSASPACKALNAKRSVDYTGIPYSSLRALAFQGAINPLRVGRAWYFLREDLDRLMSRLQQEVSK
jgi:hypothetical protein